LEILRGNAVTEKLILEDKLSEINDYMETGQSGMQTFDQHLLQMYDEELIRTTEALRWASNPEALSRHIHGIKGI
ncbi:MAG: type IV pili twitching motility protein PilT, partial [Planctomycetota bacterium]